MAMKGIDVSGWQKGIDLSAVPADFVIMKATEGVKYISKDCDRQYQQAKAAGRCLGVYHYANGGDAIAEADFFLNNVKGYIHEAILCLDWESQNNKSWNKANERAWVKAWCDHVYQKTGVNPIIYVQASALKRVQGLGNYGFWVAQYADKKPTGYQEKPWNEGKYACVIRQYASTGRLAGYNGDLDLDKAYIDRTAWMKYANPSAAVPTPAPVPASTPAPSKPSFVIGKNYTLQFNMFVRSSAAGAKKKYTALTANGKKVSVKQPDGSAVMKKGTVVTCQAVKVVNGATWVKIPSGWICSIGDSGTQYLK